MNAPFAKAPGVRSEDLGDAEACRRLDAFVSAHPGADIFHRPQWSRAVERGCGQRSHYLVAEDAAGELAGCLPLTEMRSFLFGNALVSAGFGTGGGILARDEAAAASLAEAAWALAKSLGCGSVELRGGSLPGGWRRREGAYAAFDCDLAGNEDDLLLAIPKRQRAEVRKAMVSGLAVSTGRDARHLDNFYRVYAECVRNLGTPVFPARLFEAMAEAFGEDADALVIWKDGRPIAASFNFYFAGTGHCYWGGGTSEARALKANDLMFYAFMRHALERGCGRADFGRSKLGTGAYDRKRIWHFRERPLVYALRTGEGAAPREINPLNPKYRLQVALWQKLPLPVANLIGPYIACGLG